MLNLTTKFPESILASYANYASGRNYSRDFKNFHKGKVRSADTKKSISYLKEVKNKDIGALFTTQTYFTLVDAFKRSSDFQTAEETLKEFIEKVSYDDRHTNDIIKAKKLLDELT